jgi:anti-sigma B factor antagonist
MQSSPSVPPDADPLDCEITRERETASIRALGSLDVATVPILEAHIADLLTDGVRRVILDLSGLYFMDSTGLRCILDCDTQARQNGFSITLIPGPPAVQRVFDVTGTRTQLPFIDL